MNRKVHWHSDDQVEWYGWDAATQDPRLDLPLYLVKQPYETQPPVWCGWAYDLEDGSRQCVTHDHASRADAMSQIEQFNREDRG